MKKTKKILSVFLALLMIISIIPMSSITASAATAVKTQAEAVAWLNQQTNSLYGGGQCTEFVSAYMNWLVTGTAAASGSYIVPQWPQGYVTFAQSDPQNWTVIKNEISTVPQPGDIFVSGNTHTGVVIVPDGTRGATIVDQNSREGYGENGTRSQVIYKNWTTYSGGPYSVTYFIRPKFKNTNVPTTGISLNPTSFSLEAGQTKDLTATVTPSNATDKSVTWSSSNTSVATVSSSGVVTAKAGGTCTITATNSGGQKAIATVNVTSKNLKICVDGNSNNRYWTLTLGGTESINCYLSINEYYGNSIKYSYSTNNSNVSCSLGDVNSSNQAPFSVYANSTGETTITLSVTDATTGVVLDSINVYVTVEAKKYTVTYNANGGTGAPSSQTKYHNTALTLSTTIPTRSGYTFLGWSTSSTATTATYYAGGNFTSNANTTLYAVWKENLPSYTVSYDANGGTGAPASQTIYHGQYARIPDTIPTKNGYTFEGWVAEGYYLLLEPGDGWLIASPTTFVAVWTPNEYTVSYNANGGTGAPSSQTKYHDTALTLSTTKPTRSGYTFLGWSTSSTATTATYQPGANFTSNANTTLYAVWQRNASPTVHTSADTVTLTLGGTESTTIYAWATGVTGSYTVQYQIADTNIVSCAWGDWNSENKSPLTITAKSKGTTTLTVSVINFETKEILDSTIVRVIIDANEQVSVDFSIKEPSRTTIRYKDGIALHIDGYIPEGARVEWAVDSNAFDGATYDDGMSCLLVSKNNGYTTVVATLYDVNNNIIATDSVELRSKAGFFDKIGGFFRSLFGATTIYDA